MTVLEDLQAAFPSKTITANPDGGFSFSPACTTQEAVTVDAIIDPTKGKAAQAKADIVALGNWATWTLAQFDNHCDSNLMTDAAIDALTLNADLKKNIKANNAFMRNGGKMLIAIRNVAFWLLKLQGINGA